MIKSLLDRLNIVQSNFGKKVIYFFVLISFAIGLFTFTVLSGTIGVTLSSRDVMVLLNIDLALLMFLLILIGQKVIKLWLDKKRGVISSSLHIKLVGIFGAVATIPVIVVSVFSALFFNVGIQQWFSDRVYAAIHESLEVSEAYLKENRKIIATDALIINSKFNKIFLTSFDETAYYKNLLGSAVIERDLDEALIIRKNGEAIAYAGYFYNDETRDIPPWAIEKADKGDVAIIYDSDDDKVRALYKLSNSYDLYLYISRYIDKTVLGHITKAKSAVNAYKNLEEHREKLELIFSLIFIATSLVLLLSSMWFGLILSTRLVNPIMRLIEASKKIADGDLSVRVEESYFGGELSILVETFNRMSDKISTQTNELIEYNKEIDKRRRLIEAVLTGVSVGVVACDNNKNIIMINASAMSILELNENNIDGNVVNIIPGIENTLANSNNEAIALHEIKYKNKSLLVRITSEKDARDQITGYVITFDDVTELEVAQRKAAWADVARRVAHEIKNPLTPIQLYAERLKKKYSKQIEEDKEAFEACADTIVRHVGDIGRMVDEFSAFARMPAPIMHKNDLVNLLNSGLILQKSAYPYIEFNFISDREKIELECDARQIGQAFTNLIKNAVEAIEMLKNEKENTKGKINVRIISSSGHVSVLVEDNGKGIADYDVNKLTEPYVTTKNKGTGLGLAIVKKIMEDHNGKLVIESGTDVGAVAKLVFRTGERK